MSGQDGTMSGQDGTTMSGQDGTVTGRGDATSTQLTFCLEGATVPTVSEVLAPLHPCDLRRLVRERVQR